MQSWRAAICWVYMGGLASVACGQVSNRAKYFEPLRGLSPIVEPTQTPQLISINLVDPTGRPVADADVGTRPFEDGDQGPSWWMGSQQSRGRSAYRSDEHGVVQIPLELTRIGRGNLYILAADQQLMSISPMPRIKGADHPPTIMLAPACRVFGRYDSPELTKRGETLGVPVETRNNLIRTSISSASHQVVSQYSARGVNFEFFLPPGEYSLRPVYAAMIRMELQVVVPEGKRDLDLNTIELQIDRRLWGSFHAGLENYGRPTVVAPSGIPPFILTFCFSPDGRMLATTHDRGRGKYAGIELWDCLTGQRLHSERWAQRVFDIDFSPDGKLLAIAADSFNVSVFDLETKELREFANGHTRPVDAVAFARDAKTLASASDTDVIVWDVSAGVRRQTFPTGAVPRGLSLASNGSLLATSQNGNAILWEVSSGHQLARYPGDRHYNTGAILLPDDRTLLCYGGSPAHRQQPGQLRRFTFPAGAELPTLASDGTPIDAAVDRDGDRVAVMTGKGVEIWSLRDAQLLARFLNGRDSAAKLAFSPDGGTLAFSGTESGLRLFGVNLARPRSRAVSLGELKQPAPAATALALAPDGKVLITGHSSPLEANTELPKYPLRFWSASNRALLREISAHSAPVTSIVLTADGKILSASESGEIALHDAAGAELRRWSGHQGATHQLLLLADPPRLVSAGDDGYVRFWNVDRGEQLQELTSGQSPVVALAATSDGRHLYAADRAQTIHLWDLSLGKVVHALSTQLLQVHSLAVAPDDQSLAAAGLVSVSTRNYATDFGEIRQWKTSDWTPLPSLRQRGTITAIAFSPCGKYLASAGLDPQIKLWLPRHGYHWGTLERDAGSHFSRVLFSPDGTSMITSGATPVTFWRTPEPDPRILAEFDKP